MDYTLIYGYDRPKEVEELFTEYTNMLVRLDPLFQESLDEQNYSEELEHLEDKYGLPDGRLYILMDGEKPAASVALHKIDFQTCELKRLYVRPAFRGRGLGRTLTDMIIARAREAGYREMLLDTLPFLQSAQRIYRAAGFREIEKYNDSPMDDATYMKLEL